MQTKQKNTHRHTHTLMLRLQVFCLGDCSILRMSSGSEKRCLRGLSRLREQVCDPLGFDGTFPVPVFLFNLYMSIRADSKHILIDSDDTREELLIGRALDPFTQPLRAALLELLKQLGAVMLV